MSWRLAESLKRLREQINAAYPDRYKTSDGAIGDAAHASRKSDHNPWIWDPITKQWVVSAIDIDEDLNGKKTLQQIVDEICESRDERVKYIIYEGRITVEGSKLQRWNKYTGTNAHKHHAHISVFPSRKLYDNRSDWDIGVPMIQRVKDIPPAAVENNVRSEVEASAIPSVVSESLPTNNTAKGGSNNLPESAHESLPANSQPPNDQPKKFYSVEDLKPFVKRWLFRIWSWTGGITFPAGGALSIAALRNPDHWYIYAIVGVILIMIVLAAAFVGSAVLLLILWWNRKEIGHYIIESWRSQINPNVESFGLDFVKK